MLVKPMFARKLGGEWALTGVRSFFSGGEETSVAARRRVWPPGDSGEPGGLVEGSMDLERDRILVTSKWGWLS